MIDAQELAVHASITTVKVKNTTSDPELEGVGPYVVPGLGLWFMALHYYGWSLDGLSKLGIASFHFNPLLSLLFYLKMMISKN